MNTLARVKLLVSACAIALLSPNYQSAIAQRNAERPPESFASWCDRKEELAPAPKHTVEVLLNQSGTQTCTEANDALTAASHLSFSFDERVESLAPVASLFNLESLTLGGGLVTDLSPIAELSNLKSLYIFTSIRLPTSYPYPT